MTYSAFPIHVERTAAGEYELTWADDFSTGAVRIRAHTDAGSVRLAAPLHGEASTGVRIGLPGGSRHYFHLEPGGGEALIAAQRNVPLEGGTNFRDLGGYRAAGGRRVRWGRLFRSGHTAGLTDADRALVASLDIRVCCDFRRAAEWHVEPRRLPEATRVVSVEIDPGSITSFFARIAEGGSSGAEMAAFMEHINREFVSHHQKPLRRMFEELLALEEGAFLINCAAGKDRTGFASAMILAALGVQEPDILADYLLSERFFLIERELPRVQRKYAGRSGRQLELELILPMMETRETYLRAALDEIRSRFGGFDAYLEQAFGVGPEERRLLRERFTE